MIKILCKIKLDTKTCPIRIKYRAGYHMANNYALIFAEAFTASMTALRKPYFSN